WRAGDIRAPTAGGPPPRPATPERRWDPPLRAARAPPPPCERPRPPAPRKTPPEDRDLPGPGRRPPAPPRPRGRRAPHGQRRGDPPRSHRSARLAPEVAGRAVRVRLTTYRSRRTRNR